MLAMPKITTCLLAGLLSANLPAQEPAAQGNAAPLYSVSGDAIIRVNGDRLNNRPLYCLPEPALAMAGDRPFVILASNPYLCGSFMAAVVREDSGHDRSDFGYRRDPFCLPKPPPPMVQLGDNCRAMVLNRKLRPGVKLTNVTLETLSPEVVIGLMGVSLMNPE
jgi:hypothetical protein